MKRVPTEAEPTSVSEMIYVKQSDGNGENRQRERACLHLDELHEALQGLEARLPFL
jgi:hypothetical protein